MPSEYRRANAENKGYILCITTHKKKRQTIFNIIPGAVALPVMLRVWKIISSLPIRQIVDTLVGGDVVAKSGDLCESDTRYCNE